MEYNPATHPEHIGRKNAWISLADTYIVLREIEEEERLWKSKEKRNAKEKVITSDDIKNAIGEATIKRDSAPRHPRAKPPIRLVSTDDNIDDIDGIPPKTMSNDISTQTETEKRRPARFF